MNFCDFVTMGTAWFKDDIAHIGVESETAESINILPLKMSIAAKNENPTTKSDFYLLQRVKLPQPREFWIYHS